VFTPSTLSLPTSLPTDVGIGLKPQHYTFFLQNPNTIAWIEIHPENYMCEGGLPHVYLEQYRERFPLSMHGVGMSLGSPNICQAHLSRLKTLVERYQPDAISEHLAWVQMQGNYFNDLLPLPYTEESLAVFIQNIDRVQTTLNKKIFIENPSQYLKLEHNTLTETEFLNALVERTGCGLLLDINNVYVSAFNTQSDPWLYLAQINADAIGEIHLAGHVLKAEQGANGILIDNHGAPVAQAVWELYQGFLAKIGRPLPTLIEWDSDIPSAECLLSEVEKAKQILQGGQLLALSTVQSASELLRE